ncbi:hypothetical protein SLH47_23120 [Cognatiyoonia sp. IB215182]|nr:hypothetical protein [Cognatiyoonia sp. IB215182]
MDIILSGSVVLNKTHKLPKKARKQASKILELRADALRGSSQNELHSTSILTEKGRNDDTYTQILVREADLHKLEQLCHAAERRLRIVSTEVGSKRVKIQDHTGQTDRPIRYWWAAFGTFTVITLSGLLWHEMRLLNDKKQQLALLRSQLSTVQQELDDVANINSVHAAEVERLDGLLAALRSQQTTDLLANLTQAVSAETWVAEFVLLNNQLRISGQSQLDPISVIATLEDQDWTRAVTLARPVRTDRQTQLSSFDVSIDLQVGAP